MKTIYNIMVCLLAVCLFSCQQGDMDSLKGMGYLRLDVSESKEFNTRAAYNPEQLYVEVLDENKIVVEKTDDYTEWKGTILELPAGKYTINAYSNAYDGERGFDKAYYYGSQTATVESGKEVSAKVTCTLANVKVTVRYDEAFLKAFEGREIAVEVGAVDANSGIAPLSFTTTEKRSAYFPETDLYAKISINNPDDPQNPYTLEQKLEGVKVRDHYILNYKLADKGSSNISVTVDPSLNEYNYTFEVNMQESALTADFVPNAWAKFAYLEASNVQSSKGELDPENVTFKYRKKGDADWNDAITTYQDGKYTATLTPLEGKTEYEYCLADGENMTSVQELTTEGTVALYNGSFDLWSNATIKTMLGTTKNDVPYLLDPDESIIYGTSGDKSPISFWDSGNAGGASMSKYPTKKFEDNGKIGAVLSSQYIGLGSFGKFAAGNIYTGHYYYTNMSPMGAQIFFGQPFTSRPIQLKGRFKYTRGETVNYGDDPYKSELTNSGGDQCGLYIALTDNEGLECDGNKYAFEIDNLLSADEPGNFKYKNSIDFTKNNPNIVAYGTISEEEAKGTGEWQEFTIYLKYRDLNRQPKYIIVVASASKYGDYFTGSTSSVMYVDDFELIYDGEPVLWDEAQK